MTSTMALPKATRGTHRARHGFVSAFLVIVVGAYCAFTLLPVVSILLGSFKTTSEIASDPLGWPSTFRWENYVQGWSGTGLTPSMDLYFGNTVLFTIAALIAIVPVGAMAAYAIARRSGWVSTLVERYYLLLYTIPFIALIVPLYDVVGTLGLRSNPVAVGLVFAASFVPWTIVLMLGFYASFPLDVIEAAKMDGASELRIFWSVVLPMSKGAVLTNVLLAFIFAWNNLSHTLPLLIDPESLTIAPGVIALTAGSGYTVDIGPQMAALIISVVPLVALYLMLHKQIMEGFRVGSFR
jgi:raffinose/stachyose/melibiose transport system permease protein